jgi:hypothetical protein
MVLLFMEISSDSVIESVRFPTLAELFPERFAELKIPGTRRLQRPRDGQQHRVAGQLAAQWDREGLRSGTYKGEQGENGRHDAGAKPPVRAPNGWPRKLRSGPAAPAKQRLN